MGIPQEAYALWSAEITLGAADTTKTLIAAPAAPYATRTLYVTHIHATSLISAAQAVDIKIGSTNLIRLAASWAVGNETFLGPMIRGLRGQPGQALTIVPAAAGPSIHVIAEGYYGD
jgi:hypothetical protein